MEIPEPHLLELSEHTDFDYALAHKVLEFGAKSRYATFYKHQAATGRTVWLDNSAHELKEPLKLKDILKAAKMINATHIVPFEVRDDARQTWHHIQEAKETIKKKGLPYKIIGSWQGHKKELWHLLKHCDEVALPFDRPRTICVDRSNSKFFHYFGYRSLDEIRRLTPKSIDTSMPIRAALYGIDLTTRERRPRTDLLDFTAKLSDQTLNQVVANIKLMREAAKDER